MTTRASRRSFLKLGAAAVSVGAADITHALSQTRRVAVVIDTASPITASAPVQWAVGKLREAITPERLATKGVPADFTVTVAPINSRMAKPFETRAAFTQSEMAALIPGTPNMTLLASGSDARGITYSV